MKCIIHDDNLDAVWKEVVDSVNRQHIDEVSNKKKKVRQDTSSTTSLFPITADQQASATDNQSETGLVNIRIPPVNGES